MKRCLACTLAAFVLGGSIAAYAVVAWHQAHTPSNCSWVNGVATCERSRLVQPHRTAGTRGGNDLQKTPARAAAERLRLTSSMRKA